MHDENLKLLDMSCFVDADVIEVTEQCVVLKRS